MPFGRRGMKHKPDQHQISWAVTIFFLFIACLLVFFLIFNASGIGAAISKFFNVIMGILFGIVIAYILTPLVNAFEERLMIPHYNKKGINVLDARNRKQWKRMRLLSITLSVAILIAIIVGLIVVVLPQLFRSVMSVLINIPDYIDNTGDFISKFLQDKGWLQKNVQELFDTIMQQVQDFINNNVLPNINSIVETVADSVVKVVTYILNFLIGIVAAIYMLFSKEKFCAQAKKISYALFSENVANHVISECRFIHYTFTGFLTGKIVDSIIIGILCFIGTSIIGTPYAGLVSVLVGVTNVIPIVGPYIGGIVGFLFILIVEPIQALYFGIFVIVLQQFDGNILGPKILGSSTGLPSFWVLVSIILFGGYFGIVGMIIGVPLFAVLYSAIKRLTNRKLKKRGMPQETDVYQESAYFKDGVMYSKNDPDVTEFRAKKPHQEWGKMFGLKKAASAGRVFRERFRNNTSSKEEPVYQTDIKEPKEYEIHHPESDESTGNH